MSGLSLISAICLALLELLSYDDVSDQSMAHGPYSYSANHKHHNLTGQPSDGWNKTLRIVKGLIERPRRSHRGNTTVPLAVRIRLLSLGETTIQVGPIVIWH